MTGEGGAPEWRAWQPVDSSGNVMGVGDTIRYGSIVGQIECFVACPVIRSGCNQMVVANTTDWGIVPRDNWEKLEEDADAGK